MAGPMRSFKPKRPPNSWILFRADVSKRLPPPAPGQPRRSQADVSALISSLWREADDDTKRHYERLADEAKVEHRKQFPDYKFQPTKKEDKERLKELQKEQRDHMRKNRSARGVNRSPNPPAAARFASSAPYQIPHLLFGPSGPTPPVSAASSPRDHAPVSPAPSSSVSSFPQTSNLSSPTSLPANPTSTSLDQTLRLPSFSSLDQVSQADSSAIAPILDEPQLLAGPSTDMSAQGTSGLEAWVPAPEGSSTSSIHLSFGENSFSDLQAWSEDSNSFFLDPFQSANGGAGMFEIHGFNDLISTEPVGDLEVSVGQLDGNPISSSYFDTYGEPQVDSSNAYMSTYPPQLDFNQLMSDLMSAFPDIPVSTDSAPTLAPTNIVDDVTDAADAPTQSTPYQPPAGAANSSMRRVGAKWTPETMNLVSPPPQVSA